MEAGVQAGLSVVQLTRHLELRIVGRNNRGNEVQQPASWNSASDPPHSECRFLPPSNSLKVALLGGSNIGIERIRLEKHLCRWSQTDTFFASAGFLFGCLRNVGGISSRNSWTACCAHPAAAARPKERDESDGVVLSSLQRFARSAMRFRQFGPQPDRSCPNLRSTMPLNARRTAPALYAAAPTFEKENVETLRQRDSTGRGVVIVNGELP